VLVKMCASGQAHDQFHAPATLHVLYPLDRGPVGPVADPDTVAKIMIHVPA
jgi:hypothetical protein